MESGAAPAPGRLTEPGPSPISATESELATIALPEPGLSGVDGERFTVAYLVVTGTTTASRAPELLRGLVELGFETVVALTTPSSARVLAPRDLATIEGVRLVESYFDPAILPRPPRGVVLVAPCSFNTLNKFAGGIADNLALSVVAEAIGRRTPVIVAPSLNQPLLDHPRAQVSLRVLRSWGVEIVPPEDEGDGPRLAPTNVVLEAVRRHAPAGTAS